MIRRPPRSTLLSLHDALPISAINLTSVALGLPISSISALQSKNNTKLIASTQIHAFNNEDSSARIGQRDRKSTRLNSSHANISYAVFCLKKKNALYRPAAHAT